MFQSKDLRDRFKRSTKNLAIDNCNFQNLISEALYLKHTKRTTEYEFALEILDVKLTQILGKVMFYLSFFS